jgi:hypothetical protein
MSVTLYQGKDMKDRSLVITRSLREFEVFRQTFKRDHWYKTAENTWECGEVPTWYTDPYRGKAFSIESNLWGCIPVP